LSAFRCDPDMAIDDAMPAETIRSSPSQVAQDGAADAPAVSALLIDWAFFGWIGEESDPAWHE
jgi:hypothetical protein